VEGRRLAAREELWKVSAILKCSSTIMVRAFSPPGGTPRLYGRQDARRYQNRRSERSQPKQK
jgi:hypothetical protein